MLFQAVETLKINLAASFMIGDRWRDIDCGFSAGCKTIFIDWSYQEALKQPPDHQVENLLEAAKLIADHAVIGAGPLEFFADPGKTGFELSAITRIKDIYAAAGFRSVSSGASLASKAGFSAIFSGWS